MRLKHLAGFEPTTNRAENEDSDHWATGAIYLLLLLSPLDPPSYTFPFLFNLNLWSLKLSILLSLNRSSVQPFLLKLQSLVLKGSHLCSA
jgi:hypothetical protein